MTELTERQRAVLARACEIPNGGAACTNWLRVAACGTVAATYAVVRQLERRGLMCRRQPGSCFWAPTRMGRVSHAIIAGSAQLREASATLAQSLKDAGLSVSRLTRAADVTAHGVRGGVAR